MMCVCLNKWYFPLMPILKIDALRPRTCIRHVATRTQSEIYLPELSPACFPFSWTVAGAVPLHFNNTPDSRHEAPTGDETKSTEAETEPNLTFNNGDHPLTPLLKSHTAVVDDLQHDQFLIDPFVGLFVILLDGADSGSVFSFGCVCINVSVRLSVVYWVLLFVFTLSRAEQVFLLMAAFMDEYDWLIDWSVWFFFTTFACCRCQPSFGPESTNSLRKQPAATELRTSAVEII